MLVHLHDLVLLRSCHTNCYVAWHGMNQSMLESCILTTFQVLMHAFRAFVRHEGPRDDLRVEVMAQLRNARLCLLLLDHGTYAMNASNTWFKMELKEAIIIVEARL